MNLITVMQKCTDVLLSEEQKKTVPFPLEEYNLTHESTFLDIGSGFGKPVFHASLQTYCKSTGVEVVPARVAFTDDVKYVFEDRHKKETAKKAS